MDNENGIEPDIQKEESMMLDFFNSIHEIDNKSCDKVKLGEEEQSRNFAKLLLLLIIFSDDDIREKMIKEYEENKGEQNADN